MILITHPYNNEEKLYRCYNSILDKDVLFLILDVNNSTPIVLEEREGIVVRWVHVPYENSNKLLEVTKHIAKENNIPAYCYLDCNTIFNCELSGHISDFLDDPNVSLLYSDFIIDGYEVFHTTPSNIKMFPFLLFKNIPVDEEAQKSGMSYEDFLATHFIVKYIPHSLCRIIND